MKKYEVLEHRADLKIRVFGKTKEELFGNALTGIIEAARYQGEGKEIKRKIKISSLDLASLLIDFLSEILYLAEAEKALFYDVQFDCFSEKELAGVLTGKKLKRMGVHVKAPTYHSLDVGQGRNGRWEATILFDV